MINAILTHIPTSRYDTSMSTKQHQNARTKLLNASLSVIRQRGYADTSVDHLCASAGVTKGAFFHYFKSKEELGVAAADHWSQSTGAMFAAHPYHQCEDPYDRILGYLDLREALLRGTVPQFTCLVGTMLQETYETAPAIAASSFECITSHAATLEADFAECIALYGPADCPSAASLALHTQTILQGAFILSKGQGSAQIARDSLDHLRLYLRLLFNIKGRNDNDGRHQS